MENYKEEIQSLRAIIDDLKLIVADLRKENESLRKENELLRKEILYLKIGINSRNTSMPPSTDIFKGKVQNPNRIKTGKAIGGQKGRDGNNLKFQTEIDQTQYHKMSHCDECGHDLSLVEATESIKGQIIDIPIIKPIVTEHISMVAICPHCSNKNKGQLPGTLDYCHVQYGSRLKDLIVYLSVRNYLPVKRIAEFIQTAYGIKVSDGFIIDCLTNKAEAFKEVYQKMLNHIKQDNVVGSDETGFKIRAEKAWIWLWRTQKHVYFKTSMKRDYKTIEEVMGAEKKHEFILVSDRLAAQLKTNCMTHQVCLAHLIRECINLNEKTGSTWVLRLKKVFKEIIKLSKPESIQIKARDNIVQRLDQLLNQALTTSHKKVKTFCGQLLKIKDYITTCLYYPDVPAENNFCERSIRNVKLKLKVSTNLRSMQGAESYAIIRSIIDTSILQGKNVWTALQNPSILID